MWTTLVLLTEIASITLLLLSCHVRAHPVVDMTALWARGLGCRLPLALCDVIEICYSDLLMRGSQSQER